MVCGIYSITNKINGKKYIGSSNDIIKVRWPGHKKLLNANIHFSIHLQNSWNKYGEINFSFEIIEECLFEKLDEREGHWIEEYKSWDPQFGYNTIRYINGRKVLSEEIKKKISESHMGIRPNEEARKKMSESQKGKTLSKDTKKKMSDYWKGKVFSEETKRKISEATKGNKNALGKAKSEETKRKLSEANKGHIPPNKGVPMSEEQKEKIRKANTGKKHSEETKKKISEMKKGKKLSIEAILKRSESMRGSRRNEETRKKMSDAAKKREEKKRQLKNKTN